MSKVQAYFDNFVLNDAYDRDLSREERATRINDGLKQYFSVENGGCIFVNFASESMDSIPTFAAPIRHYFDPLTIAFRVIFKHSYKAGEATVLAEDSVSDLQGALVMMHI